MTHDSNSCELTFPSYLKKLRTNFDLFIPKIQSFTSQFVYVKRFNSKITASFPLKCVIWMCEIRSYFNNSDEWRVFAYGRAFM